MIKIEAPSKVNLFLKITALRPDGYHELKSLFAFLDLKDEIIVNQASSFKIEVEGKFAHLLNKNISNNILTKTLNLFVQKFNISPSLHIKLIKNIPVSAGLGGGSSNAAAFMRILNLLYQLNLSKQELQKISLELGSDIAFFLEEKACLSSGRGEVVEKYYEFDPMPVLIINPNINLSTKAVYDNFDQNFASKISDNKNFDQKLVDLVRKDFLELIKSFDNDLLEPAVAIVPEIFQIIKIIEQQKGCLLARMSGSGASCFGIFSSEDLDNAYNILSNQFQHYFILKSKIFCKIFD